jgi:hypothetical protein
MRRVPDRLESMFGLGAFRAAVAHGIALAEHA